MRLLVTGGTGYIGSHTVVELLNQGHDVVIVDNLSNSSEAVLPRIEKITANMPTFINADIRDAKALDNIFLQYAFDAVIHFAGLKAVGESSSMPLNYYDNNVSGSLVLFQVMAKHNVKQLVFSSSATVYGANNVSPLVETMATSATNPYGQTKLMIEQVLFDLADSDADWSIINLRYFNPIGAHQSGLIGEDPNDIPNNLLPYVAQVAIGRLAQLSVYGDDYDTHDGTGVRDYIHVVDLALGHLAAVSKLRELKGCHAVNLGTGQGTSVLDIVEKFKEVSQQDIPYKCVARRKGDLAEVFANANLAKELLSWQTEKSLQDMIEDTWRWQSNNPNGYK